jgi:trans-aconitate 2-methyltransferase
MNDWNPSEYLKFRNERTQPPIDLAARIVLDSPSSIIDIGCGPGNSTAILCSRWPEAATIGLDTSPEMIRKAQNDYPLNTWILGDAAQYSPREGFDLVFSNAALQWMPHHEILVPHLFAMVNRNGALAVQVPANSRSPLHQALLSVSSGKKWSALTAGCSSIINYQPATCYYDLLCNIAAKIELWETTYYHRLSDHQSLIAWYRSTGMRPYLDCLPDDKNRIEFEEEVLDACINDYPLRKDGSIIFPFSRIFFIAYR